MSLLQDEDYVISHLRATYLDTCVDGVGERIIRPSHLYITKTGPKPLNWAASTLLSQARPDSPPIPTDTFSDRENIPFRRGSNVKALEEDEGLTNWATTTRNKSISRHGQQDSKAASDIMHSFDAEHQNNYQDMFPAGGRSRGLSVNSDSSEYYKGGYPDNNNNGDNTNNNSYYDNDIGNLDSDEEDDGEEEAGYSERRKREAGEGEGASYNPLTPVYENDADGFFPKRPGPDDSPNPAATTYSYTGEDGDDEGGDEEGYDEEDDVDEEDDDDDDGDDDDSLSGLSEEDDSDIEEELEFAAQQIKKNALEHGNDSSPRPASANTSPRVRKQSSSSYIRKDSQNSNASSNQQHSHSRRHRSVDLTDSPNLTNGVSNSARPHASTNASNTSNNHTRTRTTSTKSGGSISTMDLQPPFYGGGGNKVTTADTDSNSTASSALSSAHDKLEIGLGLRNNEGGGDNKSLPRDKSSSLLGPALKATPLKPPVKESKLTSQILAKQSTFDNPLEQYIAASGKSERKPLKIKMYMPTCSEPKEPWEVVVRTDINVHMAIGFSLYVYSEQKRQPELSEEHCDANKWNLRIVEEDGEPDEDFPALDRTRNISAYSFDEFALVEASPEQAKENERITPNTKKITKTNNNQQAQQQNSVPGEVEKDEDDKPEKVEVFVFQYPFNDMTSNVFWKDVLDSHTTLREVLETLCQDKMLDHTMYAFKSAGTRIVLANDMKVSSLEGQQNIELTPRRIMTRANGYVEENNPQLESKSNILSSSATNPKAQNVYTALAMKGAEDAKKGRTSILASSSMVPEVLSAAGYQKYKIWRRQPMSFNSRHERIFAIDGEYVHIMPSEDKTYIESPKTSSFHISQVMKCKQSRKIPANFKVVVRKTSGPKRYDLEAISATQSAEIVGKVRSLATNYRGGS